MPNTATTQTDPDGQALMRVFTDLGASPEDAYNATQGVRNMAGQNVTARLEAKIETLGAGIRTEIGHLSAKVDGLEGQIDGLAPASQVDALASQVASQGVQLQTLTTTVQDLSSQMVSLTSQTEVLALQMQSLLAQVEPLVSPTSGLAAQVAALTVQVQGQAAQADFANSMMTLLVLFIGALLGTSFITWFSDWRRSRRGAEAGGSSNRSESQ